MEDNSSTLEKIAGWLDRGGGSKVLGAAIVVLLIVSILMPPISAGARISSAGYATIALNGGSVSDPDGTQVTFPADGVKTPFKAKLSSLPRAVFLAGTDGGKELKKAAAAIPSNLILKSPFYQLSIKGTSPTKLVVSVPIPNDSEPYETLDLYTWNGKEWRWMPSKLIREDELLEAHLSKPVSSFVVMQNAPQPAGVNLFLHEGAVVPKEAAGTLTSVMPLSYALKDDKGHLQEEFSPTSLTKNEKAGYSVLPVIRNWDDSGAVRTDLVNNLLKQESAQDALVKSVVDLTVGNLYPGVVLDLRDVDVMLRPEFSGFVTKMADSLHKAAKILVVRVDPPRQIAEDRFETGAYDWYSIGQEADLVQIPAPIDPLAYKKGGAMDQLMIWAVGHVPRQKIQVVLPGRSVERAGNYFLLYSYEEATAPLLGQMKVSGATKPGGTVSVSIASDRIVSPVQTNPQIAQRWYSYRDNSGNIRTVWLEDSASMAHKLGMIAAYDVNGVALDNLPSDTPEGNAPLFDVFRHFVQGSLGKMQAESGLAVAFSVNGKSGQVAQKKVDLASPSFSFQVPGDATSLDIQAGMVSGSQPLGTPVSMAVTLATPTPSPTPVPPATPTPVATPTPTAAPYPMLVTNETINLRSGPGTVYSKVGETKPGKTYRIIGKNKDGSWWEIAIPGGKKAWISAKFSKASGDLTQVAVEKNIPKPPKRPAAVSYPRAPGFFGYGVQAHMVDNDQAPRVMQAIKDLGFGWVKQQVEWKRFEPSKGNYQWGPLDYIVNTANQYGVNVMFSVAKAPKWARPSNTDFSVEGPPANPQDFADFMGAMAARYKGRVKAYEIWNEQNLWYEWGHEPLDAGRYVQLLAAAYRAIKAQDPNAIVVSGALTPTGLNDGVTAVDDMVYLEQMYQHGLKRYCDAVGAHPSGYNVPPDVTWDKAYDPTAIFRGPFDNKNHSWSFRSTMEGYRNIMVKYGDAGKRIWPTEFGWASSPTPVLHYEYAADNTLEEQAQYTVRAYQMMKAWGWVGVAFLWNLNFKVVAPGSEMAQWGIVGHNWEPLPVYNALKAMPK